jgi:prepilin-type processing-associated H-X9-DG protein
VDANHIVAKNFTVGFDNGNVSYFVGVDADDAHPQMLLSGDSNLAVNGKSAKSGLLTISQNHPATWTSDRHINQGNLGFADGSVWQGADDKKLEKFTGRLAIP